MAETTTITRPAPVLEASLTNFLKAIDPLVGQQIQTSAFAPQIAAESQLQKDARTAAAGLGSLTGPDAFKPFMSPYQQEVIDTTLAEGGMLDFGGKEMDLRKGGFVPIGKKEKADDVPARLSKNEFVMTADAVRAAGGGDINKGAKRMYETMNKLEARA